MLVVKDDNGGIRICGDYNLMVNAAVPCDSHPIPRTEDLFVTLRGGQKFSKLDLSYAYQQLKLDEKTGVVDSKHSSWIIPAH